MRPKSQEYPTLVPLQCIAYRIQHRSPGSNNDLAGSVESFMHNKN